MNFEDLKRLIDDMKESISCRDCETMFEDEDIRVLGTVLNEGFFAAKCINCGHTMVINVVFKNINRKHRQIESTIQNISENDILDMRNFLKEFNGDFIGLFGKK